jgi:ABC-type dipeptide/oligopeptide/nickel transport system ATPase subunit
MVDIPFKIHSEDFAGEYYKVVGLLGEGGQGKSYLGQLYIPDPAKTPDPNHGAILASSNASNKIKTQ